MSAQPEVTLAPVPAAQYLAVLDSVDRLEGENYRLRHEVDALRHDNAAAWAEVAAAWAEVAAKRRALIGAVVMAAVGCILALWGWMVR